MQDIAQNSERGGSIDVHNPLLVADSGDFALIVPLLPIFIGTNYLCPYRPVVLFSWSFCRSFHGIERRALIQNLGQA